MRLFHKYDWLIYGLLLVIPMYYLSIADRTDFWQVAVLFGLAFVGYGLLLGKKLDRFYLLLGIGVVARLVFWDSFPSFSQDFYRFIWDGTLWNEGFSAYALAPSEIAVNQNSFPAYAPELLEGMGSLSRKHHSNYPPLNQFFFWLSTIGADSIVDCVVRLRFIIILADLGALYFMRKLMVSMGIPPVYCFLYFLNPLLVLEGAGNLHFESVMVFFCISGLYFFQRGRLYSAGMLLAGGILTKLLPLIILPVLLNFTNLRKNLKLYGAIGLTVLIGVVFPLLLLDGGITSGFVDSVLLWFGTFEFNASLYYLVRAIGYEWVGYNIIGVAAPVLAVLATIFIFAKAIHTALTHKNTQHLLRTCMWVLVIYFLFATTVHPWYLLLPLAFSVFTRWRFMVVWSALVFLSYAAYSHPEYRENLYLVAVEYLLVAGYLIYEWRLAKPTLDHL